MKNTCLFCLNISGKTSICICVVYDSPILICTNSWNPFFIYRQTSNVSRILVGNEMVDHSNYIFSIVITPGFNGLGKGNCKTRRETFKVLGFGASYIIYLTVDSAMVVDGLATWRTKKVNNHGTDSIHPEYSGLNYHEHLRIPVGDANDDTVQYFEHAWVNLLELTPKYWRSLLRQFTSNHGTAIVGFCVSEISYARQGLKG